MIHLSIIEHNPFGEEDDDAEAAPAADRSHSARPPAAADTTYDSSLNPFGDEEEHDQAVPKVEITPPQPQPKKKLIPAFNPFEDSDDEEVEQDETVDKKKIIPEDGLSAEKRKNTSTVDHNIIILPDTSKKITPKKKPAPPPPSSTQTPPPSMQTPPSSMQNPPSSMQAPPTSDNIPTVKSTVRTDTEKVADTRMIEHGSSFSDKFIQVDNSKLKDLEGDENMSPDVHKKKHRPAPPRPMPHKRRVSAGVSKYACFLDCSSGQEPKDCESKSKL